MAETDEALVERALDMYANWIETKDPLLSARDAFARNKQCRPLDTEQMRLVLRLRDLAVKHRPT